MKDEYAHLFSAAAALEKILEAKYPDYTFDVTVNVGQKRKRAADPPPAEAPTEPAELSRTYLTVKELAAKVQLRPETIRQEIAEGALPAYKFGNQYRIREDEAKAWIDSHPS